MESAKLSKRAWEVSNLADQIFSIWHKFEGPAQNIFRILSYLVPWVPGLGWGVFILESVASFFGYGMADLGAAIDRFAGFTPSEPVDEKSFVNGAVGFINSLMTKTEGRSEDDMVKIASFGAVMKLVAGVPKAMGFVWSAVKFLLLAFGLSNIGEIYTKTTGQSKKPGELYLQELDEKSEEDDESSLLSSEQLKNLVDPSKLLGLVGAT